jgi:D-3-phosphoglycerate dehydrogenase
MEVADLELLLKESDVVVVAVPLTDDTENLLSSKEFGFVKKGAILVSISREKVINKKAVLEALNTNKLFGFGFDAEIAVPISKDDPYLQSDKIVITPHTASITEESEKGYATMTAENIKAFQDGKPVRVVN